MVKKQLFSARRGLAIILALSMVMSHGVTALAEDNVKVDTDSTNDDTEGIIDKAEVNSAESHTSEAAVEATSTGEGHSSVEVKGNVTASLESEDSSSSGTDVSSLTGISASSEGSGSSTKVEVGGGVTADAVTEESSTSSDDSMSSVAADSKAISIGSISDGGSVDIKVTGDVKSSSNGSTADGVNLGYYSEPSEGDYSGLDISSGDSYLLGPDSTDIESFSSGGISKGTLSIDIGGDLSAINSGTGEWDMARGIFGGIGEGNVSIKVGGDISATSNGQAEGIQIEGTKGKLAIEVVDSVIEEGTSGWAIGLGDGFETADIDVTVGGNVIASNTAVNITKSSDKSTIDLIVDGTIEGGEHNIVLSSESEPKTDNLNITVWKVDTSKTKGEIVVNNDGKQDDITKKVEENINYIIKIDEKSTNYLSPDKKTAKQDDTVILKLNVPSGYAVDSFYNGKDAANVNVLQDSSGNYYLVVPRGGGVYVGVNLRETGSDSSTTGDNTISVSVVEGSRTESGASDGEYWSPSSNNQANALGGVFSGYETLQALQIPSAIYGGPDMFVNVADVLTPVDTITAMNSFTGTDRASINTNNVMGAGIVDFKNMFVNASSNTVEVPVPANVVANQSYTVMFSDGTSIVVPCAMNGVLSIPFSKTADGLTYIICGIQLDPSMFIGMPPATGWTY